VRKSEKERIEKIFKLLERIYPKASTQLRYENPFQLLIAVILSAQCTDKRVNFVTQNLFKKYKSPADYANAKKSDLENDIRSCGLYRNKSKNIIQASKLIVEKYEGKVPDVFEELINLPGVGRKTANVILANAFGEPAFAVDTHVYRLAHRLGLSDKQSVFGVEKDLMKKIPRNMWNKAHHLLIQHGRNVCTARRPKCTECKILEFCPASKKAHN
jgi:endonuclease-3